MSSRALRKAQKEREKFQLEEHAEHDSLEELDVEYDLPRDTAKPSIFAMLKEDEVDDDESESLEQTEDKVSQR